MLFCSIDSDAPGWKHGDLRAQKELQGLPSVAFLESDGTVILQVPSQERTVEGFRARGERAQEYLRLRAATAAGDRSAAARFLRMQLEERQLVLEQAVARRGEVDADAELGAVLDRLLLHLRIQTELQSKGQEGRHELGPRFYALWTKGPKPGPEVSRGFWYAILEWAERERKPAEFAEALAGMRECLGHTDPDAAWVAPLLDRYEEVLHRLRSVDRERVRRDP